MSLQSVWRDAVRNEFRVLIAPADDAADFWPVAVAAAGFTGEVAQELADALALASV